MKLNRLSLIACTLLAALPSLGAVTVKPVPWDTNNLTSPHTVVAGTVATLAATVDLGGSADSFTYFWKFGDGSANQSPQPVVTTGTSMSVGNVFNLSVTHSYPVTTGVNYTAVITVTDTTTSKSFTGNYYIIVQPTKLEWSVNQAIDAGLWFLHTSMDRATTTNANSQTVAWGGWDGSLGNGCLSSYDCLGSGGLDATNVQAFEVNGHYENGPSVDPYSDDVARGLARVMYFLVPAASNIYGQKIISYNPALMAARCSDGTQPDYTAKTCATGTYINYNAGATSCPTANCTFPVTGPPYDSNNNGQVVIEGNDGIGDPGYQTGMMVTAIVASQNKAGIARTGTAATTGPNALPGILGQSYLNIVQDLIDGIGYCQYYGDDQNAAGYDNGGGWEYYCAGTPAAYNYYDDNSPSQWNAFAMISANRGFGITVPKIVTDTNQVWVTWSQDVSGTPGQFGYNEWNNQPWGPFAVTPSGMVQLAMDGIGRTAANNPDQRWNLSESYYRNNFCNSTAGGSTAAPLAYTYGLFSFTKAMEEHAPGGVLTPITFLAKQPSNTSQIDWYGAQASAGAACDGVAQTLVSRQNYGGTPGAWYGEDYSGYQFPFETAWSTIMLAKTTITVCVKDLGGVGKASSRSSGAVATLTWSGITDAQGGGYNVQRSSTTGGPYTKVGSTTGLAFNDQTAGLVNGKTYYYVLQPYNSGGAAVCTSNQASITIP